MARSKEPTVHDFLAMRGEIDQFASIERLLRRKPGSRRAVVQLFNAEDIATDHKEIPCTTTLQFHLHSICSALGRYRAPDCRTISA